MRRNENVTTMMSTSLYLLDLFQDRWGPSPDPRGFNAISGFVCFSELSDIIIVFFFDVDTSPAMFMMPHNDVLNLVEVSVW
jgi:hypothetical protein